MLDMARELRHSPPCVISIYSHTVCNYPYTFVVSAEDMKIDLSHPEILCLGDGSILSYSQAVFRVAGSRALAAPGASAAWEQGRVTSTPPTSLPLNPTLFYQFPEPHVALGKVTLSPRPPSSSTSI